MKLPAVVLILMLPLAAQAKTVNIEYILDASGSMLELMGNEQKIDIAKKTLASLLEGLPKDVAETDLNVGLRVYGHKASAKDDPEAACKDTLLEVPMKGVDVAAMKEKIAGIKAKGRTPIAYSLEQAKNDFLQAEGADNIIILVSDGLETCGGDPCRVAKELHEAGIKVKIHVVGFDIKPEEKAQLECIAKAAGGQYFAADSAEGLSKALAQAKAQVLKKEAVSVKVKATGAGTLRFQAPSWLPGPPYLLKVVSASDGKEVSSAKETLGDLMLPAGEYRMRWRQWQHKSSEYDLGVAFTVKGGEVTTLSLDAGIHLVPPKWVKEPPYQWMLKDPETGKEVLRVSETFDPVPAPPGIYELWYRQWQHDSSDARIKKAVEIKKGSCAEVELNTGVGIEPSAQKAEPPYKWVLADKETGKEVLSVKEQWGPVPAPPGKYTFSIQQTQHGHTLTPIVPELELQDGQLVQLEL